MKDGMHRGILIVTLAAGLTGCDSPASPLPSAPSTTPSPAGTPWPGGSFVDVTLSGTVYEVTATGRVPIDGVVLYCERCGAETHTWAYTDSSGFYRFTGVWVDGRPTPVHVRKDGFGDPVAVAESMPPDPPRAGWREVMVSGDTRLDIELARR
jgi:hypothetical protein